MARMRKLLLTAKSNPFGSRASLHLDPGLYLIEVTTEKTLWVSIPNEPADQALSIDQATEELMKPALAALRAHQQARDVVGG